MREMSAEQGRMIVRDRCECMRNCTALTTLGGDSPTCNVTLGSNWVEGGRGYEMNMK